MEHTWNFLNPVKGDVSDSALNAGGGTGEDPIIANSYFETYKSYDHMQKNQGDIKKKITEIEIWKFWDYEILLYLALRKLP